MVEGIGGEVSSTIRKMVLNAQIGVAGRVPEILRDKEKNKFPQAM